MIAAVRFQVAFARATVGSGYPGFEQARHLVREESLEEAVTEADMRDLYLQLSRAYASAD